MPYLHHPGSIGPSSSFCFPFARCTSRDDHLITLTLDGSLFYDLDIAHSRDTFFQKEGLPEQLAGGPDAAGGSALAAGGGGGLRHFLRGEEGQRVSDSTVYGAGYLRSRKMSGLTKFISFISTGLTLASLLGRGNFGGFVFSMDGYCYWFIDSASSFKDEG